MLFKILAEDYVTNKRVVAHVTADTPDDAVRNYSRAYQDRYVVTVDRVTPGSCTCCGNTWRNR